MSGIWTNAPTSIIWHWSWKCPSSPQCQHIGPGNKLLQYYRVDDLCAMLLCQQPLPADILELLCECVKAAGIHKAIVCNCC